MRKQVRHVPISTALYQRWQERGHRTTDWPDLTWFLETAIRRKLRAARKRNGPTAIDIVYGRKTRKAEDKELELLASHLSADAPTSVRGLCRLTRWHNSKTTRLLKRLAALKRATLSAD